mmetsp:Transcript_63853/g.160939  ORF Transcript_63853/g.160939 Transcript_63853/m.160939 type:complete len:562 (+) Transcript_63853:70-1755(+)
MLYFWVRLGLVVLSSVYLVVSIDPPADGPPSCTEPGLQKDDEMGLFQIRQKAQAGVSQNRSEAEQQADLHVGRGGGDAQKAKSDLAETVERERREAERIESGGRQGSSQRPVTKRTSESFFQRMQDALANFILGWVLIAFSVPILWFNESRAAQMESLIAYAKSDVRTADGKKACAENLNWLVHIEGAGMHGAAPVADRQFDVSFDSGCIRLRSSVEVYQVIEHKQKEEGEKMNWGNENATTFTYTEEWSSIWHDSQAYAAVAQRGRNVKPTGLVLGSETRSCGRVELGGGFVLSEALVEQCSGFQPAAQKLGEKVRLKRAGLRFNKTAQSGYYFHGRHESSPQIGDARVSFHYIPDGPATVMALQADKADDARATFLPYRAIARPVFSSLSEVDEKKALLVQAQKSAAELADEAGCTGCLSCLCCACNLVVRCCSAFLTPEICHIFDGSMDQHACFKEIELQSSATKWCCRLVGWLMMFIGLYALFSPLLTLITAIPFLGPLLAKLGGWLIWLLCLFTTLVIATLIVMLAYLFYHPLLAFLYGLAVTAMVLGPIVVLSCL